MADPPSPLGTTNWDEWSYVMAVQALTNDGGMSLVVDADNKPFLDWDDKTAEVTERSAVGLVIFGYFAHHKLYFRVTSNDVNVRAWQDQVDKVTEVVSDLSNDGKRGTFDLSSLSDLLRELRELHTVLTDISAASQVWVDQTSGEDGPVAGQAVDVMRARLDQYQRTLETWAAQLTNDSGANVIKATETAHATVQAMINKLADALLNPTEGYSSYAEYLKNLPSKTIGAYQDEFFQYLYDSGIDDRAPKPIYKLDDVYDNGYYGAGSRGGVNHAKNQGMRAVEAFINDVLSNVPMGGKTWDVRTKGTWVEINRNLGADIKKAVDQLDELAREVVPPTIDDYTILSRSFPDLAPPATLNANTSEWMPNLNTDLNLNTPNLNLDLNLPNFDINTPDLDAGTDGILRRLADTNGLGNDFFGSDGPPAMEAGVLNQGDLLGGGGAGSGLGDFSDALANTPELGGDFGAIGEPGSIPGLDGSGSGLPGAIPGLGPVGGLGSNGEVLNPNGRPILGSNGEILGPDGRPILGPNGEILGPGGQPILGPNGEVLGPGGQPILGPNGEVLGPGGQPILGPNGEVLGPDGQPILGPNGEILGPDGQPILGPNGEPILGPNGGPIVVPTPTVPQLPDFSGGGGVPALPVPGGGGGLSPIQVLPDGTLVSGGGSDTDDVLVPYPVGTQGLGAGGFPMYPPMGGMGGMGAGRPDKEERERQTWLTEDEAVWGTSVGAVGSVIGRPEDADDPDEELVVLGPVRGALRPDSQPGPKPRTRKEPAKTEATTSEAAVPDGADTERETGRAEGRA